MTRPSLLLGACAVALSCALTLVALEIILRFLPVDSGFYMQPVTQENPVARFAPSREFTWSDEWNFAIVNHGYVNNAGYVNDQDYDATDPRPLIAVIGDSFVQSAMVPFGDTLHGRLTAAHQGIRTYSFATAGAPLSQYLVWADDARKTYAPKKMVFLIMGNDFDESLPQYKMHEVFQQFVPDEKGELDLKLLREFHPSPLGRVVSASALFRYLFFNLEIVQIRHKIKYRIWEYRLERDKTMGDIFVANTAADVTDERMDNSKKVVDAFFRLLPSHSGLKPSDILFVIDAPRPLIYETDEPRGDRSYFEDMAVYFSRKARTLGYETIDMTKPFTDYYRETGHKVEFDTDQHWNGEGHRLAFEKAGQSRTLRRFLAQGR